MKRQILILGAGPAGLSLAYNLLRRFQDAFEITVLEREDVVGGRRTQPVSGRSHRQEVRQWLQGIIYGGWENAIRI